MIKSFWKSKQTAVTTLLVLTLLILALFESIKVSCEYLDSSESCNIFWKVPYWSLLIASFLFALWGMTTSYMAKVFRDTRAFARKRPFVTIVIVIVFFGLLPFPVRCTQTVMPKSYSISPGDDLRLLLLNDLPLQNSQCYLALTKEYWFPQKPTLGVSTGPFLGFLIATFD